MKTRILVWCLAAFVCASGARGIDLPFNFQIGFVTDVVPSAADTSAELGLGVVADELVTDKARSLVVRGRITNYSTVPCEGLNMRFAVSSYISTSTSRSTASVSPGTILPGETATFTARVLLGSEKPKLAMYTITATSPVIVREGPPVRHARDPEQVPKVF
jgi:hypothetical protein